MDGSQGVNRDRSTPRPWAARARGAGNVLVPIAVLGLAVAARLQFALASLTVPHPASIPDDAFYDFGVARHLALGQGPTFDGSTPTNGFHPLWVALLAALWKLFPDADRIGPIHAAMVLGTVLDVASLFLLFRICRRRLALSLPATAISVAWLAVNPFQVMLATCGLEAPLAQLLLVALLDEELSTWRRPAPRWRWGVIAGLTLLARVDLVIPIAVLWATRRHRARSRGNERANAWLRASTPALLAAAIYAPWLFYSRLTTGRWLQSSSVALPFSHAELPIVWGYPAIALFTRVRTSAMAGVDALAIVLEAMGSGAALGAALLGAGVAAALLSRSPAARRMAPYGVGLIVLLFAHGCVRRVFREWYAFPYTIGAALLLAHALTCIVRRVARPALALAIVALLIATGVAFERNQRRSGYWGVQTLEAHLPAAAARWGDTDGGVWCYLRGGGGVNLDGIVNWDALDALRSGTMLDYVAREGLASFSITERYRHPRFMGRHWRERIMTVPAGWSLATIEKKDRRIQLSVGGVNLGGVGAEMLSDGWLWPEHPAAAARSLSAESEIIFVMAPDARDAEALQLELASIELEDGSRCSRVTAELDGRSLGALPIGPRWRWVRLPTGRLAPGRHRLVLHPNRYGVASNSEPWRVGGWQSISGNALTAFEARGFIPAGVGLPTLPPEGPDLEDDPEAAILGEGWLPVERVPGSLVAVWAAASSASLHFRTGVSSTRTLVIRGSPPPPDEAGAGQDVTVELNAVTLGTVHFEPGGAQDRELTVPPDAIRRSANELVLHFARRWSADPEGRAFYFFGVRWKI